MSRKSESRQVLPRLQPENKRRAGLRAWGLRNHQQNGGSWLERPLKAEPGSQRHAARDLKRNIAEINCHHAKTTRLQQPIENPQCLLDCCSFRISRFFPFIIFTTPYPQQAFKLHTCAACRIWMKRITGIYQGTELATLRCRRQGCKHYAGPPRGKRP